MNRHFFAFTGSLPEALNETEQFIQHLETETNKAVDYGVDVSFSVLSFLALASLVGMFLKKL